MVNEADFILFVRNLKRRYRQFKGRSRYLLSTETVQTPLLECFRLPILSFAIDFELYWCNAYQKGSDMSERQRIDYAQNASKCIHPLKQVFIDCQMPCTWAVVAKLIEPDGRPAPHKSFNPTWANNDWYEIPDMDTDLFEAQKFILGLKDSELFEIVSHGFGHIEFADPSVTEEIAAEDILLAKKILKDYVTNEKVFIYSSNKLDHTKLLPQIGYNIVRGDDQMWHLGRKDKTIRTPEGFWISPSMISLQEAIKLVDEGIKNRSFIHPWTHPRDINMKAQDIERFYRPFFMYIKDQEKKGNLDILSFQEIWERINQFYFS